uniref:DDE Tnp4 domain-containing protein n=1 Tax=Brassica oleracea var. oleracea TaxID=109376 RepID=A0A0D3D7H3_BRAOL
MILACSDRINSRVLLSSTELKVVSNILFSWSISLRANFIPKWSTIGQTISDLQGPKKKLFAARQEACQKDVERAFGVLQAKFAIVAGSLCYWKKEVLHDIMTTCIIMHNMIIEDERDINAPVRDARPASQATVEMAINESTRFQEFLTRNLQIKNQKTHFFYFEMG